MMMPIRSWLAFVSTLVALQGRSWVCSLEVGHDDLESLVFLADQVLHRHLYILKGDICCSTRPDTLTVHSPRRDTAEATLDEENTDTVRALPTSSDSGGKVLGIDTVGNPLLFACMMQSVNGLQHNNHIISPLTI